MSTRLDIIASKRYREEHIEVHGCRTGQGCAERLRLWHAYMRTARLWGLEPGDAERARQQSQSAA